MGLYAGYCRLGKVMAMRGKAKTTEKLVMDFYLPCAISGLLLAGLIALTTPASSSDLTSESGVIVALN